MKIYKATKKIEVFDIDENDFFNFIKKENPDEKDIQNKNSWKELIEDSFKAGDFGDELNKYTLDKEKKILYYMPYNNYYDNYCDAYDNVVGRF